jgi:hypothetical protein
MPLDDSARQQLISNLELLELIWTELISSKGVILEDIVCWKKSKEINTRAICLKVVKLVILIGRQVTLPVNSTVPTCHLSIENWKN